MSGLLDSCLPPSLAFAYALTFHPVQYITREAPHFVESFAIREAKAIGFLL